MRNIKIYLLPAFGLFAMSAPVTSAKRPIREGSGFFARLFHRPAKEKPPASDIWRLQTKYNYLEDKVVSLERNQKRFKDVKSALQTEKQRLIEEAERLFVEAKQLEKKYRPIMVSPIIRNANPLAEDWKKWSREQSGKSRKAHWDNDEQEDFVKLTTALHDLLGYFEGSARRDLRAFKNLMLRLPVAIRNFVLSK